MSRTRALTETLILSVLIPVIFFAVLYLNLLWMQQGGILIALAVFLLLAFAYHKVTVTRHHELGTGFVLLTAFLSFMIQFTLIVLLSKCFLQNPDVPAEGHPDGNAVLVSVLLFAEPLLMTLSPLVIRFFQMIVRLFSED